MRLHILACEVLTREVCLCIARSPNVCAVEFLPKNAHEEPARFRALLQSRIDAVPADAPVAAIALVFGLCGNTTAGLVARSRPLVIPRAHDCCTLFLGDKRVFREHFADHPSRPFSATGYMEHDGSHDPASHSATMLALGTEYASFVAQYGEENARFIWETLHPPTAAASDHTLVFVDVPETTRPGDADRARARADADGLTFLRLPGSLALVRKLIDGDWEPDAFVTVPPGHQIAARYDWDNVLAAEPATLAP